MSGGYAGIAAIRRYRKRTMLREEQERQERQQAQLLRQRRAWAQQQLPKHAALAELRLLPSGENNAGPAEDGNSTALAPNPSQTPASHTADAGIAIAEAARQQIEGAIDTASALDVRPASGERFGKGEAIRKGRNNTGHSVNAQGRTIPTVEIHEKGLSVWDLVNRAGALWFSVYGAVATADSMRSIRQELSALRIDIADMSSRLIAAIEHAHQQSRESTFRADIDAVERAIEVAHLGPDNAKLLLDACDNAIKSCVAALHNEGPIQANAKIFAIHYAVLARTFQRAKECDLDALHGTTIEWLGRLGSRIEQELIEFHKSASPASILAERLIIRALFQILVDIRGIQEEEYAAQWDDGLPVPIDILEAGEFSVVDGGERQGLAARLGFSNNSIPTEYMRVYGCAEPWDRYSSRVSEILRHDIQVGPRD